MFRPREFHVDDLVRAAEHLRVHPFGVLVSADGGIRATHLPFLLGPSDPGRQFPATVVSHGSARNPHLRGLTDGTEVLVIVPGPDVYVSAAWYEAEPDVPTWNYTALHVAGRYRRLAAREDVDALLGDTVARFEDDRGTPGWRLDELDGDLVAGLARGVIAFAVDVDDVRAVAKLGQDKLPLDVVAVHKRLRAGPPSARAVAEEMARHDVRGRPVGTEPSTTGMAGTDDEAAALAAKVAGPR
jgi:transcriptional regulator